MSIKYATTFGMLLCAIFSTPGCSGCRTSEPPPIPTSDSTEPAVTKQVVSEDEPGTENSGEAVVSTRSENPESPASENGAKMPPSAGIPQSVSSRGRSDRAETESRPGSPLNKMSLPEALAKANVLEKEANAAAKRGDQGAEFSSITKAWQIMRKFPGSGEATQKRKFLEARIEAVASQLQARNSSSDERDDVTLIEK